MTWDDEQEGYDVAIVCENGHTINTHRQEFPEFDAPYCADCGAPAVYACVCKAPVQGDLFGTSGGYVPPAHCSKCGKPHIWTERKAEGLKSYLEELDVLSAEEIDELMKSIPDLLAETPMSDTAVLRFKKALRRLPDDAKPALAKILMTVSVEAVKKSLGF